MANGNFDWNQYPAESDAKSGFDWNQFPSDGSAGSPEKESSIVPVVRNLAQGVTGNFSDELSGGVEAAGRVVGLEGLGGPIKDISLAEGGPTLDWEILRDAYHRATKKEREALKKDMKENPGLAVTANLAGAVVSPINKLKMLQGASMMKSGSVLGGIAGAGASDADTVGGVLADTAIGAGGGAIIGKVADKAATAVEKGIKRVGEGAKKFSDDRAAAALGATKALRKKIGAEKTLQTGRAALDEGILTPLSSPEKMASRAQALKERGGKMMGKVYDEIDNAGVSTFNPLDVASKVDNEIGGFYRSPINRGEAKQLENTLESILMRGDKNIPLKEAQILKEEIKKVANWKNNVNVTDKERMAREAYRIVNTAIDDAADNGAKQIGTAGLKEALQKGKRLYSAGKTAGAFLDDKIAQQGNNFFGLTDYITAGAGLGYGGATGDWETAAGAMALKKAGQKYGNQIAAKGADALSKVLLKSPRFQNLARSNPRAFQATVLQLANKLESGGPLPKVAQNQPVPSELDADSSTPAQYRDRKPQSLKGPDKWSADGFDKLMKHDPSLKLDREKLMSDPKTRELLIQASDLRPGSKALEQIKARIKNRTGREQK